MPQLSIIVPIYNGSQYLYRCVDSILEQEYRDYEVILVDDGSSDDSLEICYEYERKDSRVIVLHKQNAGLVSARKSGLSVAKGKYIGFVDCDDYIEAEMYSGLMEAAQRDNADIAIGGIIIDNPNSSVIVHNMFSEGFYDKEKLETEVIPQMLTYSGFLKYGIIPGVVVKVFKRELLEEILPKISDNISIGEDVAITSYSILAANSVSIVHAAAYHYVQDDESMIHKFDSKRFEKICNLHSCLTEIQNEDYLKQLDLYMAFLIFIAVVEIVKNNGRKKEMALSIKQMLKHDMSQKVLRNVETSDLQMKDKTKIILMRYAMVRLLMLLI